jgi:hypothetical protein
MKILSVVFNCFFEGGRYEWIPGAAQGWSDLSGRSGLSSALLVLGGVGKNRHVDFRDCREILRGGGVDMYFCEKRSVTWKIFPTPGYPHRTGVLLV